MGEDEEDEVFSLHFPLEEVKSGLMEVKEKLDEIQMGDGLPGGHRSFRDSCELKGGGVTRARSSVTPPLPVQFQQVT